MKTDNELIAEFMGWQKITVGYFGGDDETDWQRNKQNQKWMKDVELEMVGDYIVNVDEDRWEFWDDVAYNTSWDWLMPVVEAIEGIEEPVSADPQKGTFWPYQFEILGRHTVGVFNKYTSEAIIFIDQKGSSKIESVYKAVVEFIKWYNEKIIS